MKTNLLFGAALIASLAVSAPSTNAKSAMDHNLKCLWMNTDVAPLHTSARQGVAVNGKFYLQNKDTQKIEIWDQTGKVGELDSGKEQTSPATMLATSLSALVSSTLTTT